MKRQLTIALALALASFTIFPTTVRSLPDPPPAPPPPGHPTPGGTYGPSSECKSTAKTLNALIPEKNLGSLLIGQGLTTSLYPTFWVYIPYAVGDTNTGKFSLHNRRGHTLYQATFSIPKTPGIISIQLPSQPEYALEEGKFYHWYFSINCSSSTSRITDLVVDGWVKRVALTPEYERQINTAQPEIWYDAITRLANLRLTSPQDDKLKSAWNSLLNSGGLEQLSQEQLFGSVPMSK